MTRSDLQELFKQELPGEDTHVEFAPVRGRTSAFLATGASYKESAVAIVLSPSVHRNGELTVLITQRQQYEGKHSGQLSFPGGKREASDVSLQDTAIRECFEEIGLELRPDDLVGKLSQLYIPVSGFLVDPYVFYLSELPDDFQLNEREVQTLYKVELEALFEETAIERRDVEVMEGKIVRDIPHFIQGEIAIWGATAILLNELKILILRNR